MPLGIDRTHFYAEKVKRQEKEIRAKDERVAQLETENAMLYLKLAQLHGTVQSVRQENSSLNEQVESEQQFRNGVSGTAIKLHRELETIRNDLRSLQSIAIDIPEQFQKYTTQANKVVQRHRQVFQSQNSSMTSLQSQVTNMELALQEITERHAKEKKRRQELHNILMELRGNIRVHCRIRPLMEFDCGNEDSGSLGKPGTRSEVVVHFVDDENVCCRTAKHNKVFEYERVFGPTESQNDIFEEVQPMLTSLLDGYNICIMAYGQTGSGKTHTMLGSHKNEDYNPSREPHRDEGVIPRAARELFRLISEKQSATHKIEVSVLEIYNNEIRDLLSNDPSIKHDINTSTDGTVSVPTLSSKQVDTVYDVMCLVQHGLRTRRESATMVHEHSSRSHLVVTLTVISQAPSFFSKTSSGSSQDLQRDIRGRSYSTSSAPNLGNLSNTWSGADQSQASTVPGMGAVIRTKLQLVDLAGSECVGMSGVKGAALREASNINKSLSALADVLGALAEHRSHVPYRNTRLTHLLQDSIGGDAKLLVLLCVSPAQRYITESLQCLGFGTRARQVQRGPTKRRLPSSAEKVDSSSVRPRSASTATGPSFIPKPT
ncbi:kinesin-like protein KIF25 isoform X2 [Saccostrea echinata]|uniref:kinesin-like protein KIF25 isoform X2 n=1 Tax=Saccostrea echinata TaxID=191078 RepID=UPI002A80E2A6|nr:kinesin-like protein KIF25 isoform X2 [Saccostrea echinata]